MADRQDCRVKPGRRPAALDGQAFCYDRARRCRLDAYHRLAAGPRLYRQVTLAVRALVDNRGAAAMIGAGMIRRSEDLFRAYKALSSPALRAAIEREQARLDLPSFRGLGMTPELSKRRY